MARRTETARRSQIDLVARALGQSSQAPRILPAQLYGIGLEAQVLALPCTEEPEMMQNEDGLFYFMAGVSEFDGEDVFE